MTILLVSNTAIELYRKIGHTLLSNDVFSFGVDKKLTCPSKIKSQIMQSSTLKFLQNQDTITIGVFDCNSRQHSNIVTNKVCSSRKWLKLESEIYVACVFDAIQDFAKFHNKYTIMSLMFEFCGSYRRSGEIERGFRGGINQLISSTKLKEFFMDSLEKNKYIWGNKKINQVIKYVEDNSASPQETRLFCALHCSRALGGYNIKNLALNTKIVLSAEAKNICDKQYLVGDIVNVGKKVVIEYDSKEYHGWDEKYVKDRERARALEHDGWKVFSVSPDTIRNRAVFNSKCREIYKAIIGNYPRITMKTFYEKQALLLSELNR